MLRNAIHIDLSKGSSTIALTHAVAQEGPATSGSAIRQRRAQVGAGAAAGLLGAYEPSAGNGGRAMLCHRALVETGDLGQAPDTDSAVAAVAIHE